MLLPLTLVAVLAGSLQSMGATEGLRPPPPTTAEAAAAQATPGAAPEPAAPARERLICTSEQVTGTRFPIRRCRTAAQIAADRVESQEMLRRQQGARVPPAG